mmetsp:Transcript_129880/g.416786  ORF Transcript_129880/g.416786 Transcript_129880/m.416786 type:complete len:715 (-) Transcript_129880:101-2245(-)|eukprot:CAMPEP_0203880088 /NCGR_PEP_ID=MMETSP0359-20131031/24498_1 /ASSEMBLY_ACC=CAM_ASM_000338 /TAXON_ID=268821 /ORGANISM="Scrippsiella Hangoei, Strain SHTV-5" /LENGTH=714 /DNA_ID=CAMNT_0050799645 /DNA_START=116 /DNA_END=2260 /DNA_ORIENTATION=-
MARLSGRAGVEDDDMPHFEPIDFDDLHELLEGVDAKDDPVSAALELGVQETKRVASQVDQRLEELEQESIGDYVASFQSFQDLHKEIQETDHILEKMEKMLGTFQSDLTGISDEIRMLQGDSLQMNMKLRNRRALQSLMSEYVNSVVVSPTLVKQISDEEINEAYLEYLSELNRKLDHVKQQEMQKLPSCAQSTPQLEQLRTKAVARIKDFLLQKINTLKRPRTNLQILQRNVLVKFKFFTQFLAEHHPAVAREVQQHYVETMSGQYLKQFKTYVSSLQKLELEYSPTRADLLVSSEWQSSSGARRFLDNIGLGPSVALNSKGNVFSLSGRDAILKELEKDPIIAHTHKDKIKYYHEQLFRSHQMLLMDTATSEFLFLNDFFDTKGDHGLFVEVFGKTTQFFLDSLETFLVNCWDSVGLMLMIRIVDFYRKCMQRRKVSCLDSYLDAQQLMIRPRLRMVLDENVKSLRKACQQNLPLVANTHPTHPHLVTRRYAELAASLYALSSPEAGALADSLQQPLTQMQQEACALCRAMSSKLENQELGLVFLVNNYDLVLTVFHERHLPRTATTPFEELLKEQVQLFIESQLMRHFPDLVMFVKSTEPHVADVDESTARAQQGPPLGVDVQRMEQVVRKFSQSWNTETRQINSYVMTSFTNFSNGSEILNQVLMQLLLYYTRLQKIIAKSFPKQPPAFSHEMVTSSTLLMEIKQYSRSF